MIFSINANIEVYTDATHIINLAIACENSDAMFETSKDFPLKFLWTENQELAKSVFERLISLEINARNTPEKNAYVKTAYTRSNLAYLLNVWCLSYKDLAKRVFDFVSSRSDSPKFVVACSSYDFVAFCNLFNKVAPPDRKIKERWCYDIAQEYGASKLSIGVPNNPLDGAKYILEQYKKQKHEVTHR